MKRVILPLTALATFALATTSFADQDTVTSNQASLASQIQQLDAQTKQLEKEVAALKSQEHKKKHKKQKKTLKQTQPPVAAQSTTSTNAKPLTSESQIPSRIVRMWQQYVTVTTVPFTGKNLAFNGGDLLYNVSSMNEDLTLLKQKQEALNQLAAAGYQLHRPILQFSGSLAGQIYSSNAFTAASANGGATSGITLSTGELDINAMASSWATGFMALSYNGAPVSTGNRSPNSTIYLERGFLTLGNLNVVPVYFSIGEMYSPFGLYTTSMVSTPETQSLMQIRTPTAVLGFSKGGFNASVYAYQGSETSGADPVFKQGGVNGLYKFVFNSKDSLSFGGGWTSNVADSQGMQGTGYASPYFNGFGSDGSNNLVHSVDGGDVNANLGLGPVTFIAEYIASLEAFAPQDLTFDGSGARPVAEHYEVDYALPFLPTKYATTLGSSYDHTEQSLGMNLEKNKYAVFLNTSLLRETVESIEYNYQQDYSVNDISSGNSSSGTPTTPITGTGKNINTVLLQVAMYF